MNSVVLAGLLPALGGTDFAEGAAGASVLIPAHPTSRIENRKTSRRGPKVFTAGSHFSGVNNTIQQLRPGLPLITAVRNCCDYSHRTTLINNAGSFSKSLSLWLWIHGS